MDSLLPFLQGSFRPYNMSVYPGALRLAGNTPGTRRVGVFDAAQNQRTALIPNRIATPHAAVNAREMTTAQTMRATR